MLGGYAPLLIEVDFAKPLTAEPHTVGFADSYIIPSSLDIPPYCYIENGQVTDLPVHKVAASGRPTFWREGMAGQGFSHENCLQQLTAQAVKFIAESQQPFSRRFTPPAPHTPHCPRPPFRGQKSDVWDGGHRVPFLARWPDRILAGSQTSALICLTDLLVTVAALVGAQLPDHAGEDSVNNLPTLLEGKPVRDHGVSHSIVGEFALRRGPWKYVDCHGSGGWSSKDDPPTKQLYDMEHDAGEQRNRIADLPEMARALAVLLEQIRAGDRTR